MDSHLRQLSGKADLIKLDAGCGGNSSGSSGSSSGSLSGGSGGGGSSSNGINVPHPRMFGRELKNIIDNVHAGKGNTCTGALSKPCAMMEIEETHELMPDRLLHASQPVSQYSRRIFDYLQHNEYMTRIQRDINEKMRAILVDWLVDVHLKFKLLPETFFLTINLIDRYLSKQSVARGKLQLVGVAAMFIACKYEEIYAPEVKDFVHVCDRAYNKEEIFQMESSILLMLSFDLTQTSSLRFLERFLQLAGSNNAQSQEYLRVANTARYLLELSLLDLKMLRYTPSLQAASALVLAHQLVRQVLTTQSVQALPAHLLPHTAWNQYLEAQTQYQQCSLDACTNDLHQLLQHSERPNSSDRNALTAIKRKFSLPRFAEVAKFNYFAENQLGVRTD